MNYEAFYKNELFPKEKVEITDEYLKEHGWKSYTIPNRWYSFEKAGIGRINVTDIDGRKYYTLHIKFENGEGRRVRFVSDIKANVYAYLCGHYGVELRKDGTYGDIEDEGERSKWMYETYMKMIV